MTLLPILLVLLIEQFRPLRMDNPIYRAVMVLAARVEHSFNAGAADHGRMAWLVMVSLLVLPVLLAYWLLATLGPFAQLAWSIFIVYLTLGFRHYSHYFTSIQVALTSGDLVEARRLLQEWTEQEVSECDASEIARLAVENALITTHRHVFGVFFWLLMPIGPAGAVLYRLSEYMALTWNRAEHAEHERFGAFAKRAFYVIDWIPARLTAVAFAIVGNFEDSVYAWRHFARRWTDEASGIILSAGGGAMGVRLGTPAEYAPSLPTLDPDALQANNDIDILPGDEPSLRSLRSTVGLIWRALLLWILLLLMVSVAHWLG